MSVVLAYAHKHKLRELDYDVLVTEEQDRPELHSHVTFYAEDQHGKHKILLNKEPRLLAAAIAGCPKFLDVLVTE